MDYFFEHYLVILLVLQGIIVIIGLMKWNRMQDFCWKVFLINFIALWIVNVYTSEVFLLDISYKSIETIYLFVEFFEFLSYFYVYIKLLQNPHFVLITKILATFYIIGFLIYATYELLGLSSWMYVDYFLGAILICNVSILALHKIAFTSQIFTFKKNVLFWFSLGVVVCNFIVPLCMIYLNYDINNNPMAERYINYMGRRDFVITLQYLAAIISNVLWIVGFAISDFRKLKVDEKAL